nr:MAG TPA: hypothetical protein [Caudoviricetes sp.]
MQYHQKYFILTIKIHLENLLTFQHHSVIMIICRNCKI